MQAVQDRGVKSLRQSGVELWDHVLRVTHGVVLLANAVDERASGSRVVSEGLAKSATMVGSTLVRANAADDASEFIRLVRDARLWAIEADYWLRLVYVLQPGGKMQHDLSGLATQYTDVITLFDELLSHIESEAGLEV